ncbi:MAG: hypothetical protein J6R67_04095 [Treponema sp.]|nr:hypothetical protein [Treponema sp.]
MSTKSNFDNALGDLIITIGDEIAKLKGTAPITEINNLRSRLQWGEYERTPAQKKDLETAFKDFLDKQKELCIH